MKNFLKKQGNDLKNINRTLIITVFIIFLSTAGWSLWDIWQDYHLPAEETLYNAVTKTLSCENYQFTAQAVRETDAESDELCVISGEVNGENTHLSGRIPLIDGEFELYQIVDRYYRRDSVDGKWLIIDDFGREATERLIAEISPLDFLRLEGPFEVDYLGKEMKNNEKCRKFQVMNYVTDEYMTYGWQDIFLTVWVNKHGYINQALIRALECNEPQKKLNLNLSFSFGDNMPPITAPIE